MLFTHSQLLFEGGLFLVAGSGTGLILRGYSLVSPKHFLCFCQKDTFSFDLFSQLLFEGGSFLVARGRVPILVSDGVDFERMKWIFASVMTEIFLLFIE